MTDSTITIDGHQLPHLLYGTAWKEDRTQSLTELALRQGFRGIDTANQRRHYHEAAVGQGIAAAIDAGAVRRDELFLQTKFTFRGGQDHRLPYDPTATISRQVEQSFASSLEHLGVERLDSLLLHGPSGWQGLADEDWEAWESMEAIRDSGRVRWIGVSNFRLDQLELLCQRARLQPTFVQNRCFASRGWDRQVRSYCTAHDIIYQGFSLLTANREALAHPEVAQIARRHGRTIPQIIFRFALEVGMLPLTGTTNLSHIADDLSAGDFRLEPREVGLIEGCAVS